jgi:hypothetical protein
VLDFGWKGFPGGFLEKPENGVCWCFHGLSQLFDINGLATQALFHFSNSPFYLIPGKPRGRIIHQIGFSPVQLFDLSVMHWNIRRCCRQIIPEVFDELQFFRRTQVKYRDVIGVQ